MRDTRDPGSDQKNLGSVDDKTIQEKKKGEMPPLPGKAPEPHKDLKRPQLFAEKHRFTFTFVLEGEVASIHFDKERSEIFYRGHNLKNMHLQETHRQALGEVLELLKQNPQHKLLAQAYENALSKILHP